MKNKGFTLVELLAIIVILAVVLAISIPSISGLIWNIRKNAFEENAKLIIKSIETKKASDSAYDITSLNVDNMESDLGVSNDNFESITVSSEDSKVHIDVVGSNKWDGLSASGTLNDLSVTEGQENLIYHSKTDTYAYQSATTKLEVDGNDDGTAPINLGFDFNFGGTIYNTIYPSTNGYIAFNQDDAYEYSNDLISDWLTFPIIAAYWTDLKFDFTIMPDSGIYYTIGNEGGKDFVLVEWRDVTDYNSDNQNETTTGDFEVKLYSDGIIKAYYQDVEFEGVDYSNGIDSTIGVLVNENNYNQYSYQEDSIANGSAVKFYLAPGTVTHGDPCFLVNASTESLVRYKYLSPLCPSDVIIPETIDGVTVRHIADGTFASQNITSVIFPNTITTIGYNAFANDKLTSISLPPNLTKIDTQAFVWNQLTSLTIPDSVTYIGANAFRNNDISGTVNLTNVTTIGMYAFNENNISTITIPSLVGPIPDSAFRNNKITNVAIPSGVTEIGYCAFCYNQLSSVSIPNTVTSIADAAFSNNLLTNINIPSSVNSIGYRSFGWNNLNRITMGKSAITIGEYMLGDSAANIFRTSYYSGGAGTYNGSQYGSWTKQ